MPTSSKPMSAKRLIAKRKREEMARIKSEQPRVRDFLNGPTFLNWHFLMPDIQILLLQRLIDFYETKTQLTADVEFIVQFSVRLQHFISNLYHSINFVYHKHIFR